MRFFIFIPLLFISFTRRYKPYQHIKRDISKQLNSSQIQRNSTLEYVKSRDPASDTETGVFNPVLQNLTTNKSLL